MQASFSTLDTNQMDSNVYSIRHITCICRINGSLDQQELSFK